MSMDHTHRQSDVSAPDTSDAMFAPTPVWDRSRKRSAGARKAARERTVAVEPRSFAPSETPRTTSAPLSDRIADRPTPRPAGSPPEADGLFAPVGRPVRTERAPERRVARDTRPNGAMTAAIAAGVVAVGAMGAGAWYLTADRDSVPELAPSMSTTEIAAAPVLPSAEAMSTPVANEPPMAPSEPAAVEPAREMASRSSAAPAQTRPIAPSADTAAQNASAEVALPDGPQPYTTLNPESAPAASSATTLAIPPVTEAAPAPAEAPAEFPATPPIATEPAPSVAPATSPDTTPPTLS